MYRQSFFISRTVFVVIRTLTTRTEDGQGGCFCAKNTHPLQVSNRWWWGGRWRRWWWWWWLLLFSTYMLILLLTGNGMLAAMPSDEYRLPIHNIPVLVKCRSMQWAAIKLNYAGELSYSFCNNVQFKRTIETSHFLLLGFMWRRKFKITR